MSSTQTRKIVLLIVEGPSDKMALENAIRNTFRYQNKANGAIFKVVHGDGTLKQSRGDYISSAEITKKTQSLVAAFLNEERDSGIRPSDILGVAQITDLDASFASSDRFVSDENVSGVTYDLGAKLIYAPDGFDIAAKRAQKRQNLMRLSEISSLTIKGKPFPYQIFYFGIDLEHALHGRINCDNQTKRELASWLDDRYGEDPVGFLDKLQGIGRIADEYRPSWSDEKLVEHSFDQLTNLLILFQWVQSLSNK